MMAPYNCPRHCCCSSPPPPAAILLRLALIFSAHASSTTLLLLPGDGYDATSQSNASLPEDCNGHGTFCSAVAAGTVFGVAKCATIHPVRVFRCDGTGSGATILAGETPPMDAIESIRRCSPPPAPPPLLAAPSCCLAAPPY